jgi:hypothetical protein
VIAATHELNVRLNRLNRLLCREWDRHAHPTARYNRLLAAWDRIVSQIMTDAERLDQLENERGWHDEPEASDEFEGVPYAH